MLKYISILVCFLCFSACYDDFDNTESIVITELPKTEMDTDINGKILNIDIEASGDYKLSINDNIYPLNNNRFYLDLEDLTKKGQNIYLLKGNDIIGLSRPMLIENDVNYVEIKSFENQFEYVIKENVEQSVEISTDITISLLKGAIGTDEVEVNINLDLFYSEDPTILNLLSPLGRQDDKDLHLDIKSVFSIQIENENVFFNPGLSKININNNAEALFKLTEQGDILFVADIANNEINLDGEGIYVLANYTEGIYAEGLVSKSGFPISYLPMSLHNADFFSTSKGRWATISDANRENDVAVYSACQDLIESNAITFEKSETPLGEVSLGNEITVDADDQLYQISTKVIDCDGKVSSVSGTQLISANSENVFIFNSDEIDTWLPVCDSDFTISGLDVNTFQIGPEIDWTLMQEEDIFYLSSCDEYRDGFSFIKIRNDEKIYPAFNIDFNSTETSLLSKDKELVLKLRGSESRAYLNEEVNIVINDPDFGENGYAISCGNSELGCGIENCKVTHYDVLEEGWIRVKFSGTLWMQTIDPPTAGNFQIEGVILTK